MTEHSWGMVKHLNNDLPGNLVFAAVFPSSDDIADSLLSLARITFPKDIPKCLQ